METGIKVTDILGGHAYQKTDATSKNDLDKNAFLRLLTTQMRFQDPSQPQDSSEMAAQLAQFTSLEQLTNLNTTMTESITNMQLMNASINNTLAAGMVGKTVKAYTEFLSVKNDNNIEIQFDASSAHSTVEIEIYDLNGNKIKSVTLDKSQLQSGENSYSWNLENDSGNKVADGSYELRINGVSSDNTKQELASYVYGEVQKIQYGQNGASLVIDGAVVPMSYIREIAN
jgi:flagellar basal-body rod modification protein FlgD